MTSSHQLVRTFHSTCNVTDYDATIQSLGRLVGLRVLEFGETEVIGRRGGTNWVGDNSIEVAQPTVPGHAAERFLTRFGPGMHSYAFQVADLDATIEEFAANGITVGVRPEEFFCFTDPRTTGGLLFEWSNRTVKEDPRIGAPWPPLVFEKPLLDVRTQAFAGAVLPDPVAWAEQFGNLFGLTETFRNPGAPIEEPVVGLAGPDCTLALYRLPGDASIEVWGLEHPRARCHILGLGVANLDEAAALLSDAGIGIVRRTDASVVVKPADTGEVPLVLMEGLLPGDPRS